MSEQNQGQQGQAPAQFAAFAQRVAQVAAEHGVQAVVLASAVPGAGGFGPSTVHALAWTHGQPPAEWRTAAAQGLGEVALKAAASLLPAPAPAAETTAEAAPAASAEAPAAQADAEAA